MGKQTHTKPLAYIDAITEDFNSLPGVFILKDEAQFVIDGIGCQNSWQRKSLRHFGEENLRPTSSAWESVHIHC